MKHYFLLFVFLTLLFEPTAQSNSKLYEKLDKAIKKDKFKKAKKTLKKLSIIESDNFLFSLKSAQYFDKINEFDSAALYIERAIDQYKYLPISHSSVSFKLSKDALYKSSISIYDRIITINPAVRHYCNRGILKKDIGLNRESISDFCKAIELDSLEYLNYYNRGLAYGNLNLLDSAISDYSKSIQLKPDYASSYLNKGYALMDKNNFENAIEEFERALTLPIGTKEHGFVKNNIGFAYYKSKKYELAKEYIFESLKVYSLNSFAYKNMALVNIALDDIEEACKNIKESIDLGFVNQYGNEIIQLKNEHCK